MRQRAQHVALLFDCGHRRRKSNPGPKCNRCTDWRKCAHPRTSANTYTPAGGRPTCRTCRNAKSKQWRQTHDDPRYAIHRTWKNPPLALRPLPVRDDSGRSYGQYFPLKQERSA